MAYLSKNPLRYRISDTPGYRGGQFYFGGGNRSTRSKPPTSRYSLTNFITQCCIEYTSQRAGFELTTSEIQQLYDHDHDDP
jgi:hypothetical protein